MIVGQADRYIPVAREPNALAVVDAVNCQLLAMGAGFEPRTLYVGLCWAKLYWDIFYSENFDLPVRIISQNFFTFHESKLDDL